MPKKSLIETNPYLKDPEVRAYLIERFVVSSTAIEGVHFKYPKLTMKIRKKLHDIAEARKAQKKGH